MNQCPERELFSLAIMRSCLLISIAGLRLHHLTSSHSCFLVLLSGWSIVVHSSFLLNLPSVRIRLLLLLLNVSHKFTKFLLFHNILRSELFYQVIHFGPTIILHDLSILCQIPVCLWFDSPQLFLGQLLLIFLVVGRPFIVFIEYLRCQVFDSDLGKLI